MPELNLPAATGTLKLREETRGDVVVCTVVDARLEARNSFALKRHLQERLKGLVGRYVLDLSTVEFIDSSGLGALIGGLKAAPAKEALVLVRPAESVVGVFRVTRTEALFTWAPDVVTAVGPAA